MPHYRSNTGAEGIALGDLLGAIFWLAVWWGLR